ncbi:HD domain-containing protein [Vibrio sp. S4M6]|uniref:HD domain-containing phosphohydrolase n=1 Tax=Vibrio sinus TaxID=2946865 RepID=UPI00202AB6D0|nr:HD domain-containing phosphohydrolase [Vibrio sinus]MCL9779995.1 HD domain-containing protein [Vibrio sinus]
MKKRRYSLSIHITSLFLVLTTLIGVILIAISYQHSQDLLSGSVKELSKENSLKLESAFRQSANPILTTLDFMAFNPIVDQIHPPVKEKRWLASISLRFQRNANLVALFYGSDRGNFTLFRPLKTNKERERFGAPAKATLLLNYTRVSGLNEFYYFDGNLNRIGYKKTNDNEFDPRLRPWYTNAEVDGSIRLTDPYLFYFLKTHGVTLSKRSYDNKSVVGADFTLQSLSDQIANIGYSKSSKLVLFDSNFKVLAYHQIGLGEKGSSQNISARLKQNVFSSILNRTSLTPLYEMVTYAGEPWSVTLTPVSLNKNVRLFLAEATPRSDLLANLLLMRDKQVSVAVSMLIIYCVVVWLIANKIAQPLQSLVRSTSNITRFDFQKARYPKSHIKEVANLTRSIELMEHTLHDLLRLLRDTASNQDFSLLAKTITRQSYLVTKAETIVLYTYKKENNRFESSANHAIIPFKIDLNELLTNTAWLSNQLKTGEVIHLNNSDNVLTRYEDKLYNSDIYMFPLVNREKLLVGVLLLGYERPITLEQLDKHDFLKELLSFAEIAKENIDQIQQQKQLLKVFVELIASAIDQKSPYNGEHCQRIPELTKLITKAAQEDDNYFPQFGLTNQQWEGLWLASWLHDCGKVTTPEYVIDKATKLETVYDRIHEVRMRFELLKKQAEVDYWQGVAEGEDASYLKDQLDSLHRTLDAEFAFIAKCNKGQDTMTQDDLAKLNQIGQRTWKRTLDDQLGTSDFEVQRAGQQANLPTTETLLSDKMVHRIPWPAGHLPQENWSEKFILTPGEIKFNRGELHNLSIPKGTLTQEERFIINDHVIQTITMLDHLPYPEHLKNVPEFASGHHERVDGQGYPRGLAEDDLSIPARIMAIADVFEALTSSDKPYKKSKSLEEAIGIMTKMATSGHIDPKIYLLFLEKEVDKTYARMFLSPDQITDIDREAHIQKVKSYLKEQF